MNTLSTKTCSLEYYSSIRRFSQYCTMVSSGKYLIQMLSNIYILSHESSLDKARILFKKSHRLPNFL